MISKYGIQVLIIQIYLNKGNYNAIQPHINKRIYFFNKGHKPY